MKIKTIIFDYGNVIFEPVSANQIEFLINNYNISKKDAEDLFKSSARKDGYKYRIGKITSRQYWRAVRKKLGITNREAMSIRSRFFGLYRPKKGMFDLLKKLKKTYRLVAFSGNQRDRVIHVNRKYKVNRFFSEFIFSFTHGYSKRDIRFYKVLKKRIKDSETALLIDDKHYVLKNARKYGFKNGILVKNTAQLKKELRKYNVKI